MARIGTQHISSLKRALATLEALVSHGGQETVAQVAARVGQPAATAHRQVVTLIAEGFLSRLANGRYVAGPRLLSLSHHVDEKQIIVNSAAPILHELAVQVRSVVQLGTLENEMVTYRIKTGRGAPGMFSRVGMQLEAYCSGIGKVLLAHLPDAERDAYLANGPFVALTERTMTTAARLAAELEQVRARGYASDQGEIADGLACMAVPIRSPQDRVVAAISISRPTQPGSHDPHSEDLEPLRAAAARIEVLAFGRLGQDKFTEAPIDN